MPIAPSTPAALGGGRGGNIAVTAVTAGDAAGARRRPSPGLSGPGREAGWLARWVAAVPGTSRWEPGPATSDGDGDGASDAPPPATDTRGGPEDSDGARRTRMAHWDGLGCRTRGRRRRRRRPSGGAAICARRGQGGARWRAGSEPTAPSKRAGARRRRAERPARAAPVGGRWPSARAAAAPESGRLCHRHEAPKRGPAIRSRRIAVGDS